MAKKKKGVFFRFIKILLVLVLLTLAGFVLFRLDHVPKAGEHFIWSGRRFEVFQMEGRRIDKVLVGPASQALT